MLLVVLLKLRKKYKEMGSFDKSEAKCVAENLDQYDVSTIVNSLKEAGKDLLKQVPPLVKLGEWYLSKAKTTINANDFTKANALFNVALVRSRCIRHDIDEDQILGRIIETYREFSGEFAKDDDGMSVDEIRNEIRSHKQWVAEKRKTFKERLDNIGQNRETEDDYKVLKNDMLHCNSFDLIQTRRLLRLFQLKERLCWCFCKLKFGFVHQHTVDAGGSAICNQAHTANIFTRLFTLVFEIFAV